MRDDRRREIVRWSSQLDGTKREIIRTLSIAPKDKNRFKRSTLREGSLSPVRSYNDRFPDTELLNSPMTLSPCPSPTQTPTSFFAPSPFDSRTPNELSLPQTMIDATSVHSFAAISERPPRPKTKKLSSVSFREPGEDGNGSPRTQQRFSSEKYNKSRKPDPAVLITLSPTYAQHSTGVQTDPEPTPRPQTGRQLESLRSDIIRLLDAHSRIDAIQRQSYAPRLSTGNINGAYEDTLTALVTDKESII